jgi:heat shock protein HspQ|tara:strand:- start:232 stop:621 length:390 start_codon:yes stop_codon:yes gene_type:complete
MINLDDSYAPVPVPTRFVPGELVTHRKYGYRGVVVDFDAQCLATEEWYQSNQTQPAKDQPWYHVLVDQAAHVTYVAQSNLLPDPSGKPILHPMTNLFFSFEDGRYLRNDVPWNPGAPPDLQPPPPPPQA